MNRVLCSTGALIGRPNGRDYRLLAACADKLRCDGFEFMLYDTWYDQLDALAAFLSALSLQIPVFHCEKHIGEKISRNGPGDLDEALRLFELNCQLAVCMGADRMVMHLWDGLTSDRFFDNNLAAFGPLQAQAARHGLTLLVENVVCNHQDPLSHWRALAARYPSALFTLDTKMAAFHDQLECLYAPENRDIWPRVRHLHVNDYNGGYMDWANLKTLPIGGGRVDFGRLFAFLPTAGYQGDFTVEATAFDPAGVIHFDVLNETFAYIRAHRTK